MCAVDIQTSIPLFNVAPSNPVNEGVSLRLGIDTGEITFYSDTGRIVSDVINYAAHLEKAGTEPGCVSLSGRAADVCDQKLLSVFSSSGVFEGFPYRQTSQRLDTLFGDPDGCLDVPFAESARN